MSFTIQDTLLLVGIFAVAISFAMLWVRLGRDRRLDANDGDGAADAEGRMREVQAEAVKFETLAKERLAEVENLKGDISKLRSRLDDEASEKRELSNTISRMEAEMKAAREAAEEKIEMLTGIREKMESRFRELAAEALKSQGEEFSKKSVERLQATLTPLKEHVGHFEKELKAVHKATIEDRAALKAEIEQLSKRSEEISRDAVALTRALKSDQQKQGAWGEMVLQTILERSGLREGMEYETQAHRTGDEGQRLRPDVVVNIPGNKTLVIDSKVSLVAYSEAVDAESDEDTDRARKRHVASMKTHIDRLAERDYQHAEDATVDYVIMFVPIEGALSEALRADGSLTEYALEKSVVIATPTTLMMALKTVKNVWAVERRNQNAEEIARQAGRIYDKVEGFIGSMEKVGERLEQARASHEEAFGRLSRGRGNLLVRVETLKKLGARTSKSIEIAHDDEDALEIGESSLVQLHDAESGHS